MNYMIIVQDTKEVKMRIQRGIKKDSSLTRFVLAAHPIIEHFIEMLQIREIISTYVRTDQRMRLEDDKVLPLLIHNILTTPNALYEMEDWLKPLDAGRVGLTPEETQFIQDDRIGRALARFYDSRHKDVFFRLALRAIKIFDLDCSQIHHDTTTVTIAGKYGGWSATELLNYGKNKDHRPDLKQLVLGLNVTADGAVPISHRIYDGNQTDERLHPTNHKALQKLLRRSDFIYVADCKLATEENLQKISVWHGLFVSVMPRTWKEDELFRDKVRQGKIKWKHILSRKNNRKPESKSDRYYVAEGDYETSHGYRLHWIRSTQKAEQDAETRTRHIHRALDRLRNIQTKVNTYNLKQTEVAKKLGTTQAAISQYVNSKRAYKGPEKFETLLPTLQAMAKKAAKRLINNELNPDEVSVDFCKLCSFVCKGELNQPGEDYNI